jgi:aspartyl-tRNA(Asn)/glutamyl-tRNA(Gln) amidotransferase subunit A
LFTFSSVADYHDGLEKGDFTCLESVDYYLARIQQYRHLNAFVSVYADEARAKAQWLDNQRRAGEKPGRLHGVVVGLKDVISYQGHPLHAASKTLENFTAIYSATVVERMLEEGAIIIGHLNCDEFAMGSTNEFSYYGKVLNPRDESRVPGGSSGGSAAAQAAGLCMIALGSDTGGSVRQPADFCGVIGYKPGYGRFSRHGLVAYASSFDQVGIFGNSIADIALVQEVIAGPDEFDGTLIREKLPLFREQPEAKYRIAYLDTALDHPSLDPGIRRSIYGTIESLKELGHSVNPVSFDLVDYLVPAYYVLTTAEASTNLSRYDGIRYGHRSTKATDDLAGFYRNNRSESFGPEVKRRIMLGTFVLSAGYYDAYYAKAQKVRRIVREKLNEIFNSHDVIFLPNSPVKAFSFGEKMNDPVTMYLADIYTVIANLAGIPAISLPLYRSESGLPYGLQVMTAQENELILLQVSSQLMKK